jgi:hypothetical protein
MVEPKIKGIVHGFSMNKVAQLDRRGLSSIRGIWDLEKNQLLATTNIA